MNKHKRTNGFTLVEGLLVLLTLSVIGLAGYVVAQHISRSKPVSKSLPAAQTIKPPAGWKTYTSTHSTISFSYPASWQLKPVRFDGEPDYYLENMALTGPNNFEMDYTLENTHTPPLQNWACTTPLKQTNVPLNSHYNIVLDGTVGIILLTTNPKDLLPDDFACGTLINVIAGNKEFKFKGGYTSGSDSQSTAAFLDRPEVQTAKQIFSTFRQ